MMPFPMYQTPAPQPYPQANNPYSAPAPTSWQAAPMQSAPTQAPVLAAQAAQINQPKARGYAPEPKPAAPAMPKFIQLPTPEELGLKSQPIPAVILPAATPATVDWNQTHARLRQMGALAFTVNQLPDGTTRVNLTLPAGQPGQTRDILAIGVTEAAAVATMFERIGDR